MPKHRFMPHYAMPAYLTAPVLVTLAVGGLLGCAAATQQSATPTYVTMTCGRPGLAPLAETKELQERGGVQIAVAVQAFQCVPEARVEFRDASPSFGEQLQRSLGDGSQGTRFVERSMVPTLKVMPERLAVQIKINNKLPRVFRGSGTVVQFTIAGKNWVVKQDDYADLVNMIVPPRNEAEVTVYGPPISQIPEKATIGLFLYDVVTKADQAGNILEKQNFEWFYNYALQVVEERGEVKKQRMWVR